MKRPKLLDILRPYKWLTVSLILLGFATNGLNLFLPKVISAGIDGYIKTNALGSNIVMDFFWLAFGTFIFGYLQNIIQTYTAERVARELREKIINKISQQNYTYIQEVGAGKLLTNLTSDVNNVKTFVGQAVISIISSVFLIIGASVLMIMINWKLGLAVVATIPLFLLTFGLVFINLKKFFNKRQEVIDWLNKIISESILGSSIIRVLNSKNSEGTKFTDANTKAMDVGVKIVENFAIAFPVINFIANVAILIILTLGGHYIMIDEMSIGNFTAFISYLGIIIFPIIIIGFLSSTISSASASYARIFEILNATDKRDMGTFVKNLDGGVELQNVSITIDEKNILKNISFKVQAGSRTAIIGPTAAGKTQLLYMLMNIVKPTKGQILLDNKDINEYESDSLHQQVALVFQDSIMFNMSLRENIAFNKNVNDKDLEKALQTAELSDFIDTLPNKLDELVMERGTSLSGGQKQRIMLARALALNPKVLLLDDFTARVDNSTEQKILKNIKNSYPGLTLISVTQKISSIKDFDQVILLMEGEILAKGTHKELMQTSTEYVQIFDSQRSTNKYELQT